MSQTAIWQPINPVARVQPIADVSTTQQHYLGYRIQAFHSTYGVGEFIYVLGVASTIATDWVTILEDFATARLTADADAPVGVSMGANIATTWGWAQIYGKAIGGSGGAIVDGAKVYATGAGAVGTVDDAVVDGDLVHNCLARSTIAGAVITGQFQLWYPYCDNIAGND